MNFISLLLGLALCAPAFARDGQPGRETVAELRSQMAATAVEDSLDLASSGFTLQIDRKSDQTHMSLSFNPTKFFRGWIYNFRGHLQSTNKSIPAEGDAFVRFEQAPSADGREICYTLVPSDIHLRGQFDPAGRFLDLGSIPGTPKTECYPAL